MYPFTPARVRVDHFVEQAGLMHQSRSMYLRGSHREIDSVQHGFELASKPGFFDK
jgi:hypothetical protein